MSSNRKLQDNKILETLKAYMRHLVSETSQYPSLFKYCDFDGAVKMLSFQNLQFTRADSLNDKDEINISKCDFSRQIKILRKHHIPESMIDARINELKKFFSGIGICSCGKRPNNEILWNRYSKRNGESLEDGVCIELDHQW